VKVRGLIAVLCLALAGTTASTAGAATYNEPGPLVMGGNTAGPLLPYPSQTVVTGLRGPVASVRVSVHGIAHQSVGELLVLLQAPAGESVMLMRRACGSWDSVPSPLDFTFDDAAAGLLPNTGATCPSGRYRPTDYLPLGGLPAYPWPPRPYASTLAGLAGTQPNGAWKLFAYDADISNAGQINGGWSLDLATTPPSKKCKAKKHARSAKKKKCKKSKK
jgi:subtilisin-like proprotein convertase family protein